MAKKALVTDDRELVKRQLRMLMATGSDGYLILAAAEALWAMTSQERQEALMGKAGR